MACSPCGMCPVDMASKRIVICGAGIMGCSTAYYLTKMGHQNVTIVEAVGIASQASGKAGGFLAKDWNDSRSVGKMARISFQLHNDLSRELGADVGYRRLDTISITALPPVEGQSKVAADEIPAWVDSNVQESDGMGTTDTTAQVHPFLLCNALFDAAKTRGATQVRARVVGVSLGGAGESEVKAVELDTGEMLPADVVVVTLGPWSYLARRWFPHASVPHIDGRRAHSVVIDSTGADITPHALFLHFKQGNKWKEPEIYPRPDGSVYMCGNSDEVELPDHPKDVEFNEKACDNLYEIAGQVASSLKTGRLLRKQACYLPLSHTSRPIIGNFMQMFKAKCRICRTSYFTACNI